MNRRIMLFMVTILSLLSTSLSAQDAGTWRLNLGLAVWPNNCDVPASGQDSGTDASFGPNFTLNRGRFRIGGTFFSGHFHINPAHAIVQNENGDLQFADPEARQRGFTSDGETRRQDLDLHLGYDFNRYARLSFSIVMNRHKADIVTFRAPQRTADNKIILPSDPENQRILSYTDTQWWFGENMSGSIPIETVSANFSVFYNSSLLLLLTELGSGVYEDPLGTLIQANPRSIYRDNDGNWNYSSLGSRSFGDNIGITFNAGVGFQLLESPALVVYGGYNIKLFEEKQTELIDHSVFKGPFAGFSVSVF